jgi:hypothetical protein
MGIRPKITEALITISIYLEDYNTMTLIAKKNDLLNEKGKMSPRDVVEFLVKNYADKIA